MTDFSELHDELRSVTADLLGKERTGSVGLPLLARAGWTGLEIGADLGGADATFHEVAVVCEEMGGAATASGFLGTAVLGVGLLNLLQPSAVRDRLLVELAAGTAGTVAVLSAVDRDGVAEFVIDDTASGRRLSGSAAFVADAGSAEWLLVPAAAVDGTHLVAAIPAGSAGLALIEQPVLDETRRLAAVSADSVALADECLLRYSGDHAATLAAVRDRGLAALACDSLGLATAMLTATVDYVRVRAQFDRPIGSFQAVKHACADMLVRVSVARQLVRAANIAVAAADSDAPRAAAMAKA